MQSKSLSTRIMTAIAATLLPIGSALACPLLDDGANVFQGSQSFSDDFKVSTAGTLTVSISGVPSSDPISDFGFNLLVLPAHDAYSEGWDIAFLRGDGSVTIPVVAGTIYGLTFDQLAGASDSGTSSVEVLFQPGGSPSPVPLPSSVILLVSGLGLAFVRQSRRLAA